MIAEQNETETVNPGDPTTEKHHRGEVSFRHEHVPAGEGALAAGLARRWHRHVGDLVPQLFGARLHLRPASLDGGVVEIP